MSTQVERMTLLSTDSLYIYITKHVLKKENGFAITLKYKVLRKYNC